MALPESAVTFLSRHIERIQRLARKKRIVFPEGNDPRVIAAAVRLERDGVVEPILIGPKPAGASGVASIDPADSPLVRKYAAVLYEKRRARGVTESEAAEFARRPLYFAALMVAAGDADGGVGGAATSTADTVRAALHSIGMPPRFRTVSSMSILASRESGLGHHGLLAFADCAIVIEPSAVQLAEIAIASAESTRVLIGVEPAVALLSFSTKGSAKHKQVDKIIEALRIVKARAPDLHIDGELQADAALAEAVGRAKAPGSTVAGHANTLVFPDLNSANIGCKIAERIGGVAVMGPFLQGLEKPFNDLSRGCSVDDIYNTAVVTAVQTQTHY